MIERKKIIIAFCGSAILLLFIGIYSYIHANKHNDYSEWVNHTQEVISETQGILSYVQDIETSSRGFTVTGDENYLIPYDEAMADIDKKFSYVRSLTDDNPSQQLLLDSIGRQIVLKKEFVSNLIQVRKNAGFEEAQKLISTNVGERLMAKIRVLVKRFIGTEKELLSVRLMTTRNSFSHVIFITVTSIIIFVLFLGLILLYLLNIYSKKVHSENELKRYKYFFNNTQDLACIANTDGYFEVLNPNYQSVLGYSEKEFLERRYVDFIHPDDIESTLKEGEKLRAGATTINFINRYRKKNGEYLWLDWNSTPDKTTGKIYALARDITERKKIEEALMLAKKEAEESSKLKEAFLANMSHEIRTPMNAIIGFTDLLLKRNLDDLEMGYVSTIKKSGENLLTIINDILDISKIESGMIDFETRPLSISELFESVHTMLLGKAQDKNIELLFDCNDNVPEILLGDTTRLTQIIINLTSNGIKFTQRGSVEVTARLLSSEGDVHTIEFSVKDTGVGIPEDKLEHIFERFRQAELHTTRQYGGTGLGLSISKQLVELQGGNISVKSLQNIGSVFTFILPFKETDETLSQSDRKQQMFYDIDDLKTLKILVAEDNPVNVMLVENIFWQNGIKVEVVANGKLAVERVKKNEYDIILMDMEMPEMNGYQATTVIRQEFKKKVPIMAMTAHAMAGEKEKCLQLGMNDFISKPINEPLMLAKIYNIVFGRGGVDMMENGPISGNGENTEIIINLDYITKTFRGDGKMIGELIDLSIKRISEEMRRLDEAIEKTDYHEIREIAHKFKSTLASIGASRLESILRKIEKFGKTETGIDEIAILKDQLKQLCDKAVIKLQAERLNYQ